MQPLPLFGARQRTQTGIMAHVSNNVNVALIVQILFMVGISVFRNYKILLDLR